MKKTQQIAFAGVLCALSAASLLLTFIPVTTYALAALSGILLMPAAIELGTGRGLACYAVTSALALILTPDIEAKVLFIAFFGYYPIIQLRLVLWRNHVAAWVVRYTVFNVSMIGGYAVLGIIVGFETLFDVWWMAAVLLVLGNAALVLYDYALKLLASLYRVRLHPLVKRLFH